MPTMLRAAGGPLAAALLAALPLSGAAAQRLDATPLVAADTMLLALGRADVVRAGVVRTPASAAAATPRPAAPARLSGGMRRPVLGAVGGAVVGAFIGYFASQVARSDWEDEAGTGGANRRAFAIGGATLGAVAGYALMRESPATDRRRPGDGRSGAAGVDLEQILSNEIAESGVSNAYDLVQARRPRWLATRGTNTFREGARIVEYDERSVVIEESKDQTILVYLDDAKMGGVDALREIPVASIVMVRFLDARAATFRFGSGHDHGAIVVLTR